MLVRRLSSAIAATALLAGLLACGSTQTATTKTPPSSPPPASPTITSVAVSCSPTTIDVSATAQCNATVSGTGSYSSSVTWSASTGTIDSTGMFTAPASATTATITATSTQDTTKSGNASLTIQAKSAPPPTTPRSNHVVLVMEENQSYSTVVGSSAWPNLNHLIARGALATNYYANTHPSIGDYFELTTGQVLTNNDSSVTVYSADNIARHMISANVGFRVYAEGITRGYLGGNTGLYLIRHNPFAMLSDIADSTTVANNVLWPFSQLTIDLNAHALPPFSYVVPNIDDDAHNGTPQAADSWLQTNVVTPLSSDPAFQTGGDGVLIVLFDEAATSDTTHGGGHIAAVLWGPGVKAGFTQSSSTVYQHQSMLATIMELLNLPGPPGDASGAPQMNEFFVQ